MSAEQPQATAEGGRRFSFRGLRVQIVLWTVLPLTLVLIGVAFTGVYSHEQSMLSLVEERNRAQAIATAAQVRETLNAQAVALQALAMEDVFRHGDRDAALARLAEAGSLGALFAAPLAQLDPQGRVVAGTADAWASAEGQQRARELAAHVVANDDVAISAVFDTPAARKAFLLGVPLYDDRDAIYGLLVGLLSLERAEFDRLLREAAPGASGMVYLVNDSGDVLSTSPPREPGVEPSLEGHSGLAACLQDTGAGATFCQAPGGEQMTLAYAPVGFHGAGWRVILEQPWDELIGPVLRYSRLMPLVAALAAIVSLLTLYYGVRAIAQPLQALGRQAERIAWGDFDAPSTPVGGVEEIEDLRHTLDMMAKRIQSYQAAMHNYIGDITQAQEEERRRLARELHDDTTQALIALGQQLERAQQALPERPDMAVAQLHQVRADLVQVIDGIRRFSRDLRPAYLEDLGFVPALEMLSRQATQDGPLSVHFTVVGQARRLTSDLELACFRIVQETLNNVIQHANATEAWLEVRFVARGVVLSIRDNGTGFVAADLPDALAAEGHFGLLGVRERVVLHGGQLNIESVPGKGTTVTVLLPDPS